MENFDPVGGWRTTYQRKAKIDASGKLPDGQGFQSITEFKKILMTKKLQFARALTSKLLAYAIGRELTPADRPQVDQIVAQLSKDGNGFRTLIKLVATSAPFRDP